MSTSGEGPAGTVLPSYELRSLGTVFRNHLRSIPLDLLSRAQRHAPQQHDFREARGDIETRVADLRFVFLDGNQPFLRMVGLSIFAITVARNALRILRHRRVLGRSEERREKKKDRVMR